MLSRYITNIHITLHIRYKWEARPSREKWLNAILSNIAVSRTNITPHGRDKSKASTKLCGSQVHKHADISWNFHSSVWPTHLLIIFFIWTNYIYVYRSQTWLQCSSVSLVDGTIIKLQNNFSVLWWNSRVFILFLTGDRPKNPWHFKRF